MTQTPRRLPLVLACCLALIPGLAAARERGGGHQKGGNHHDSSAVRKRNNTHHNSAAVPYPNHRGGQRQHHGGGAFRGGGDHHYRGGHNRGSHRGAGIHFSGPRFRPNFGINIVSPRFRVHHRSPRVVIRFGAPAWRNGAWYYGFRAGQAGWWWGINDVWYSYSAPVYPYPVAAPIAQPVDEAPVNYYCQSAGQYYPELPECPEEWLVVPAQPAAPPL